MVISEKSTLQKCTTTIVLYDPFPHKVTILAAKQFLKDATTDPFSSAGAALELESLKLGIELEHVRTCGHRASHRVASPSHFAVSAEC
jgi:hypothetical protein